MNRVVLLVDFPIFSHMCPHLHEFNCFQNTHSHAGQLYGGVIWTEHDAGHGE